jgi:hypothetical protein
LDIQTRKQEACSQKKESRRGINLALERRNNARYEPHAQITEKDAEEIIGLGQRLQKILEEKLEI